MRTRVSAQRGELEEPATSSQAVQYDMQGALQTLQSGLEPWLQNDAEQTIQWIICPPYSGVKYLAQTFFEQQQLQPLNVPARDQLTLDTLDLDNMKSHEGVWYLPELAHTFLRQSKGLRWVRSFFAKALSGEFGKGIVICDSWAWKFCKTLWPLAKPNTLTLQAFDAEKLALLGIEKEPEHLQHLASLSRGNLGIVGAYAERRFRRWPHTNNQQSPFELPVMPSQATDFTAFVLHTLLIHCGLNLYQLRQVLPIVPPTQLDIELNALQLTGLVTLTEGVWRVTARGYPAVREALKARGLSLDNF